MWVQLQVARVHGTPGAESWLEQKDEVYGPGLRKCLQLEERLGRDGLLAFVRTHGDFPLHVHFWEAVGRFKAA
jgi:hypothetical protein